MGVEVDETGQDDPRPEVDRRGEPPGRPTAAAPDGGDPPRGVDLDQAVREVPRPPPASGVITRARIANGGAAGRSGAGLTPRR